MNLRILFLAYAFSLTICYACEADKVIQTIDFIGVYKVGENQSCIISIGDEGQIKKQRANIQKEHTKPLQICVITDGAPYFTMLIGGLDHKFSRFRKDSPFFSLNGITVAELITRTAEVITKNGPK